MACRSEHPLSRGGLTQWTVAGWVPLNFLSGGNRDAANAFPNVPALHESWSDQDAKTDLIVIGAQAAF